MQPTTTYQVPEAERNLLTNLRLSDEETNGCPALPADQVERGRAWLARILIESEPWVAHTKLLEKLYRARFRIPLPRVWTEGQRFVAADAARGFRHNQLLPEEEARTLAERGPGEYPPDKLARLLLNPLALWDVSDLINSLQPAYWLPRMEELGREYMERHGLDWSIPGEDASGKGAAPR
jgi:hypothetical protein